MILVLQAKEGSTVETKHLFLASSIHQCSHSHTGLAGRPRVVFYSCRLLLRTSYRIANMLLLVHGSLVLMPAVTPPHTL